MQGYNESIADHISKSFIDNDLEKGGEGSKGGKIIGHTKSGKPIYDHSDNKKWVGYGRKSKRFN